MTSPLRPSSTVTRLLLAVASTAILAACGGSSASDATTTTGPAAQGPWLDTQVVALAITDSIRNQRDVTAVVDCPERVRQAKGVTFACEAATRNGRTEFVVIQKDDKGNVSYVAAEDADE